MDMQSFDNNGEGRRRPVPCMGYVHVIEEGDTLYKLAKKYDVKLFDIMRLNPYVNVYNLQVGDEICIPTMAAKPEKTYVVNEGDTIEDVVKAFGVNFDTLAQWNPMLMEVELPEGLIMRLPIARTGDGDNGTDNEHGDYVETEDS